MPSPVRVAEVVSRQTAVRLAFLVLGALAIRAVALYATLDTGLAGDEPDYYARALRLVLGQDSPDPAGRAPGVIWWYAGLFRLAQASVIGAKMGNVLLGGLAVVPVFFLGHALGGPRVGLLSALLAALYPTFIAFSHYLWAEPLYVLLIASAVVLLLWEQGKPHFGMLALAGVLLGLAALTKQSGLVFAVLVPIHLLHRERAAPRLALARAACLLAATIVILLPWVLHINEPGLPLVMITRTSGMNLFVGNNSQGEGWAMKQYAGLADDRAESERIAGALGRAHIRERLPLWPLEKLAKQLPRFFTPNSFAVRRLLMPPGDPGGWGYRFRWDALDRMGPRRIAAWGVVASYAGIVLAGLAGLILSRNRDALALIWLFIVSQILPSIVTFSMSRFRLPLMIFFIVGAASLVVHGQDEWRRAGISRRLTLGASLGLMLVMIGMGYASVLQSTGR